MKEKYSTDFKFDRIGRDTIHNLMFCIEDLTEKVQKNKTLKADREAILEALEICEKVYKLKY